MEQFVFLILLFGVFYFLVLRPQQQRVKAQRALIESLQTGDEVVTAGGILGRVRSLDDDVATIETSPGVVLRVRRGAIAARIPPVGGEGAIGNGS